MRRHVGAVRVDSRDVDNVWAYEEIVDSSIRPIDVLIAQHKSSWFQFPLEAPYCWDRHTVL